MPYNFSNLKNKVKEAEEWLKKELGGVRTNRATPSVLDNVLFESYGTRIKLDQGGSVSVEDARTIRVVPWDMSQVKNMEKALITSNLGLSIVLDDKGIRVIFPELTSERRATFVKMAKEKLEQGKNTLRSIRDEVWKDIQNKEKEGGMGEDEKFKLKNEMQKMIDESQKNLESLFSKKEKEILG